MNYRDKNNKGMTHMLMVFVVIILVVGVGLGVYVAGNYSEKESLPLQEREITPLSFPEVGSDLPEMEIVSDSDDLDTLESELDATDIGSEESDLEDLDSDAASL